MQVRVLSLRLGFLLWLCSGSARAQTLSNPDVSVVADMRANIRTQETADSLGVNRTELEFHEVEFNLAGYLNPYMRADVFVGIHGTGGDVHVEEASITVLRGLPLRLQLKAGKYLLDFGRINSQHPHQWGWLEWPSMHRTMLSEEGLWPVGLQLSTLQSLGETAVEISGNVFMSDVFGDAHEHVGEEEPGGAPAELMGSGRLSLFRSFSDTWSAELGGSYLGGTYDPVEKLGTHLGGVDWKLRWRPDSYRSMTWVVEAMFSRREIVDAFAVPAQEATVEAAGVFSAVEAQFRRVWDVGGFYDFTQDAVIQDAETQGFGAWLGYMPAEETARFSLVYRHETSDLYTFDDDRVVFQIVWALGPHKPHPF